MPLSVRAWTLPNETLAECMHSGLNELVEFAHAAGMPMIGTVDPYDDTSFNKAQMRLVIPELRRLIDVAPHVAAEAARELLAIAELVAAKAHRYLVFIGD